MIWSVFAVSSTAARSAERRRRFSDAARRLPETRQRAHDRTVLRDAHPDRCREDAGEEAAEHQRCAADLAARVALRPLDQRVGV